MIGEEKEKEPNIKEKDSDPKEVSLFQMYSYLTTNQKVLAVLATIMSLALGLSMPISSILIGQITSSITPDKSPEDVRYLGYKTSILMLILAVGTFIVSGSGVGIWKYIGEHLSAEMRRRYFAKVLVQDQEWYDLSHPEKLTSQLSEDVVSIKRGSGQAIHKVLFASSLSIAGLAVGFGYGWLFALIILLTIPISFIGIFCFLMVNSKAAKVETKNYEKASSISNEAFENISTVYTLNGQSHELQLFTDELKMTMKAGIRFNCIAAFFFGLFMFMLNSVYGFGFWVGAQIVAGNVYNLNQGRDYNASDIMTIFFCVISGCMSIGSIAPNLFNVTKGKVAAARMLDIINMPVKIQYKDNSKKSIERLIGKIEFEGVHFAYPSRKESKILKGISFEAKPGQKLAFVGGTGCGKSTTIQLIERYYDACEGRILIDDVPIKDYNLSSLRSSIGYVGQEPRLFAMTIRENLLIAKPNATDIELSNALEMVNATGFVNDLEEKMDTYVGPGGCQLSGGQKQRIAIARTILQNPSILLLDESTSALDSRNEREIQSALDRFSKDRTTITIAHRLSTIQNSDRIIVMRDGNIIEDGTHEQLLVLKGVYRALVDEQSQGYESRKKGGVPAPLKPTPPNDPDIIEVRGGDEEHQEKKSEFSIHHSQRSEQNLNLSSVAPSDTLKETKAYPYPRPMPFLLRYLSGNYFYLFLALSSSVVTGCMFPALGNALAKTVDLLIKYDLLNKGVQIKDYDISDANRDIIYVGLFFVGVGVLSFISNFLEVSCFGLLAERITMNVRTDIYREILSKDIDFFYVKEHNSGELSSILAKDCSVVNAIVSKSYGAIVKGVSSMICGLVIAFLASWRLSLVAVVACPLIIATGIIASAADKDKESSDEKEDVVEKSKELKLFQEAVNNSKTVASLCCQEEFLKLYIKEIKNQEKDVLPTAFKIGCVGGVGESGNYFVNALVFFIGTYLIYNNHITFGDFFEAYLGIVFAGLGAASSQEFLPDMKVANEAANSIIKILYYPRQIKGGKLTSEIKGHIKFENVTFKYPSRNSAVFKNLSFEITPGESIGFAGPSGQGKSTIFRLLYRFYDPQEGRIMLDGVDIKDYDIEHLRAAFGVVSQEPTLFNNTVEYNIK